MSLSVKDAILYLAVFASVYVQIFYLIVFFENRKKLNSKSAPHTPQTAEPKAMTILVPCWNEEQTVDATVASIRSLDYPQDKLHIFLIDDGSTDNTWKAIQTYKDAPHIKIFTKENGGKHSALNFGLQYVETELVCSIDADTVLKQDALEKIVAYFETNKKVAAVGGSVLIRSPKTFAQKAQSMEYQMFSYNKKMLAFLDGAMVAPGAFSVYLTTALKKVGGWKTGHNLEDLELTYRLHAEGYSVEHAHQAIALTAGPTTVRKLFRQRLRWGYGFLKNSYDYRHLFLNKQYGNFGLFTMPMSLASYFIITSIFFVSWYNIILMLYDKFLIVKLIGVSALFEKFSFDFFYVNTKAIVFLGVVTFLFLLTNIFLGRFISNIKEKSRLSHFVYFYILYGFIAPFWILRSVWNSIRSARPAWR